MDFSCTVGSFGVVRHMGHLELYDPAGAGSLRAMADRTQSSVEIAAEPGAVLDVIADFERYPEWANEVTSATVLSEDGDGWADQVEFHLHAGAIKDTLRARVRLGHRQGRHRQRLVAPGAGHPAQGARRHLHAGPHRGTGTQVTYDLEVDLTMPMIGMLKRKAEKHIINTALTELKKRAEG